MSKNYTPEEDKLIDQFAIAALTGLMAAERIPIQQHEGRAQIAYDIAEAMVIERKQRFGPGPIRQ